MRKRKRRGGQDERGRERKGEGRVVEEGREEVREEW